MDKKEIYSTLPHRYPMLFVDDILEVDYGKYVKGIKNVSINEPWVQGHFPDEPVFPGVLTIETMAQICGFIYYTVDDTNMSLKAYLSKVEEVKFLRKILPGDQIVVEGEILAEFGKFSKVRCTAKVNNKVASKAIVTYYFSER